MTVIPATFLRPDIRAFIRQHTDADVPALALKKPPVAGWPWRDILEQIRARQKAAVKMPEWMEYEDIVFPPSDLIEQASSAATAAYKAGLVSGKNFVDLTSGTGADALAFSKKIPSGVCVEADEGAAMLLAHNLKILSDKPLEVIHGAAEDFIGGMKPADFVYIDPQRRSKDKKGRFRFEDCTPDMTALLPALKEKAARILVKAAPVLDISEGLAALPGTIAVYIVEWRGDCREVLFLVDCNEPVAADDAAITAVSIDDAGNPVRQLKFTRAEEKAALAPIGPPENFLYEPGPAFMKAGAFNLIAVRFGLRKLHPHTHLYTSADPCPGFPGRVFEIVEVLPARQEALPMKKANLTLRNFPGDVAGLRRQLKLAEGGDDYLFACTLENERKVLIHGRRAR